VGGSYSKSLTHHFASNGGVRLHYAVMNGDGRSPGPDVRQEHSLLLFIHGIPGFWNIWQSQFAHFTGPWSVAAMDLRGFNDSDRPHPRNEYRLPHLVGDVIAVMTALKQASHQRVILVGHDFGAIIAWWVAMLHPQLLKAMVAVGAPHPKAYLAARTRGALQYSDDFRAQLLDAAEGVPLNTLQLASRLVSSAQRDELKRALDASSAEGLRNYYRANLDVSFSGTFPPVRVPVMMIAGTEDRFVSQSFYEMSRTWIEAPCEIAIIPGGDHYLPFNSPDAFNAKLGQWLANLPPRGVQ
jgi:epoxide hydrolase 4